jgi:tRNA(Ser,Leu) C12 N-acetylase TAN1
MMEKRLRETSQTPTELRSRARELRVEAEQTDLKGIQDAALALAERYEKTAAARVATR